MLTGRAHCSNRVLCTVTCFFVYAVVSTRRLRYQSYRKSANNTATQCSLDATIAEIQTLTQYQHVVESGSVRKAGYVYCPDDQGFVANIYTVSND